MSIDDFIAKYSGQKTLIPGQPEIYRGECVQLVGLYVNEVDNMPFPAYPSAKNYWFNGIDGYDKIPTGQETRGDIVVYDGHGMYVDGHIAISMGDGQVFEQNADPDHSPAHISSRSRTYLLGSLRKKGINVLPPDYVKVTDGDVFNWLRWAKNDPNYQPTGPEFDHYKAKGWKVLAEDVRVAIRSQPPAVPPTTTVLTKGDYHVN